MGRCGSCRVVVGVVSEAGIRPLDLYFEGVGFSDALVAELKRALALGCVRSMLLMLLRLRWLQCMVERSVFSAGRMTKAGIHLELSEDEDASVAMDFVSQMLSLCSAGRSLLGFTCNMARTMSLPLGVEPSRGLWRLLRCRPCPSVLFIGAGLVQDLLSPPQLQFLEECLREDKGEWNEIWVGPFEDENEDSEALSAGLARVVAIVREYAPSTEVKHVSISGSLATPAVPL